MWSANGTKLIYALFNLQLHNGMWKKLHKTEILAILHVTSCALCCQVRFCSDFCTQDNYAQDACPQKIIEHATHNAHVEFTSGSCLLFIFICVNNNFIAHLVAYLVLLIHTMCFILGWLILPCPKQFLQLRWRSLWGWQACSGAGRDFLMRVKLKKAVFRCL